MQWAADELAVFKGLVEGTISLADWPAWHESHRASITAHFGTEHCRDLECHTLKTMQFVLRKARVEFTLPQPTDAQSEIDRQVIATILEPSSAERRGPSIERLVLLDTTADRDNCVAAIRVFDKLPGLLPEVAADFLRVNSIQSRLRGPFETTIPAVLLTSAEHADIFETGSIESLINGHPHRHKKGEPAAGWKLFHHRYPKSTGLKTASRAGCDADHRQALIFVASAWDDEVGEGRLILLERVEGRWKRAASEVCWLS